MSLESYVLFTNGCCMVFVHEKLMENPAGLWRKWSEWQKDVIRLYKAFYWTQ